MKKLIIFMMLAALSVAGIAQNKKGTIREGLTSLSKPILFTAADSVAGNGGYYIKQSETYEIRIINIQKYMQFHTFTVTLDNRSGTTDVVCTAYGKVIKGGDSTAIGSPVTLSADGTATITGTTAKNYNYLSLYLVAGSGAQASRVTAFSVKTANAFPYDATKVTGTAGLAVTGGVIDLNVSSNNAVNIGTGTTTSTVTIGGAGTQSIAIGNGAAAKTVALGSSTTTSTTTILSGSGAVNINVSNNQPTNIGTGSSSGLVTIGGNSGTAAINTSAWDISATGAVSGVTTIAASGAITATGGLVMPSASTVIWAKSGAVNAAITGADSAGVVGRRFWVELDIPNNITITGLTYLVGSVGGTDSVVVQLCNSAGVEVATSRNVGTAANIVGTAAQFQSVAFDAAYAAVAGKYYAVVQLSGTTAKLRTHSVTGCKFIAGAADGLWGTKANITPGTTYTVGKAPFLMTY